MAIATTTTVELTIAAVRGRLRRHFAKTGRSMENMDKSEGIYLVRSRTGAVEYANTLKRIVEREGVLKAYERY